MTIPDPSDVVKRPSLASAVVSTPGRIVAWHTLLTGIGVSVCGFLAGAFLGGIPHTKAGWIGILIGIGGAAASRLFGWLGNLLTTSETPSAPSS